MTADPLAGCTPEQRAAIAALEAAFPRGYTLLASAGTVEAPAELAYLHPPSKPMAHFGRVVAAACWIGNACGLELSWAKRQPVLQVVPGELLGELAPRRSKR